MDTVGTLRIWHRGFFRRDKKGFLGYYHGECKTYELDSDILSGIFLKELAEDCGEYDDITEILYKDPESEAFEDGLHKVFTDDEVREMCKIMVKNRGIDCYVNHSPVLVSQIPNLHKSPNKTPKNTPTKRQTSKKKPYTPKRKSGPQRKKPSPIPEVIILPNPSQTTFQEGGDTAEHNPPSPDNNITHSTHIPNFDNSQVEPETQNSQAPISTPNFSLHPQPEVDVIYAPEYDWIDPRSEDPLTWDQFLSGYAPDLDDIDPNDPEYEPEDQSGDACVGGNEGDIDDDLEDYVDEDLEGIQLGGGSGEDSGEENLEEGIVGSDGGTSDEEYVRTRENLRRFNAKILKIAEEVAREAENGALAGQQKNSEAGTSGVVEDNNDFLSEYEDTEEEAFTPDEEEEDNIRIRKRKKKCPVVDENTDYNTLEWKVGVRFPNREKFRDAVVKYAVAQGRSLKFSVSDKNRQGGLGARCKIGCPFKIYASWDSKRSCFVVKSVTLEHSCNRNMSSNRQLKTRWMAGQLLELFKSRPHYPGKEIIETIRRAYKVVVKPGFAYKVKYNAHQMLHGSMKEHYSKVGRYVAALKKASLESIFKVLSDPTQQVSPPIFQRFFVCFDGVLQGWLRGCRKVLCVDGCFLKTFLGGQLLAAVGRDANNQMYPLCWAVVEGENNESWAWFMNELKMLLNDTDGSELTIISDEAQAIINVVSTVLPMAEHRHCARHVFAHWHRYHRGDEMKALFWSATHAYNETELEEALEEMGKVSPAAVESFRAYNPNTFCRAYVKTHTKCDVIVNNMAETFNGYIIHARTKHLMFMLEDIRTALMQRMVVKREEASKSKDTICPRIRVKLNKEKLMAAECGVMPSTVSLFQVSQKLDTVTVDLENHTCTCRRWELTVIPCSHACACIFFKYEEPEEYVDKCYSKDTYLSIYSSSIPPCVGERHWPKVDLPLDPPPIKVGPGRPRKNRRKTPFENPSRPGKLTKHGLVLSCSVCKSTSHNKRKCPDKDKEVQPQAKRGRGRPRKERVEATPTERPTDQPSHHQQSAQPFAIGRGGRVVIRGGRRGGGTVVGVGRGSSLTRGRGRLAGRGNVRGGRVSSSRGRGFETTVDGAFGENRGGRTGMRGGGRGGRSGGRAGRGVPQGFGVYIDSAGNALMNEPRRGLRRIGTTAATAPQ